MNSRIVVIREERRHVVKVAGARGPQGPQGPAGADSGSFMSFVSEVSIAGATTLDATAFGKNHVCTGTTADYPVVLPSPSGNAGKLIGFRMADVLTKLVTLDAGAGVTIDGQQTRVMWAGETAWLLCDGVGWTKVAGKSRPMTTRLRYTSGSGAVISANTETVLPMSEVQFDDGGIADLASWRIVARRAGRYLLSGYFMHALAPSGATRELGYIYINGTVAVMFEQQVSTAGDGHISLTTPALLSPGDAVNLRVYSTTGGMVYRASPGQGIYPYLAAAEILSW